jgi:hypothetical protein
MQKYYLYESDGTRLPWRLIKNKIYLTAEVASLAMMELKQANPEKDYMFFWVAVDGDDPPDELIRRCGCGSGRGNRGKSA